MATYTPTITTNNVQDRGLSLELTRENASRAAQTPPLQPLSNVAALLDVRIQSLVLRVFADEYKQTVRRLVGDGADTATGTQLANAAAALGVTLP